MGKVLAVLARPSRNIIHVPIELEVLIEIATGRNAPAAARSSSNSFSSEPLISRHGSASLSLHKSVAVVNPVTIKRDLYPF
jgi:hypothetical protein